MKKKLNIDFEIIFYWTYSLKDIRIKCLRYWRGETSDYLSTPKTCIVDTPLLLIMDVYSYFKLLVQNINKIIKK